MLASFRFASTDERVTQSSKQMKCVWDHLIGAIFLFILILFNKEISRMGQANSVVQHQIGDSNPLGSIKIYTKM